MNALSTPLPPALRDAHEALRALYGDRLREAILFGSRARGEAGPESDVDVLVVLDGPLRLYEEADRLASLQARLADAHALWFSFVPVSTERYEDEQIPLVQHVHRDGILL